MRVCFSESDDIGDISSDSTGRETVQSRIGVGQYSKVSSKSYECLSIYEDHRTQWSILPLRQGRPS